MLHEVHFSIFVSNNEWHFIEPPYDSMGTFDDDDYDEPATSLCCIVLQTNNNEKIHVRNDEKCLSKGDVIYGIINAEMWSRNWTSVPVILHFIELEYVSPTNYKIEWECEEDFT